MLFVGRTNVAATILAEAILTHMARGRLLAASAGEAFPSAQIHAATIECLRRHGLPTAGLHSKVWGEYFGISKPAVRFLIALSDVYAAEAHWPSNTVVARWEIPDPIDFMAPPADLTPAFETCYDRLSACIQQFLALDLEHLDEPALRAALARVGRPTVAA